MGIIFTHQFSLIQFLNCMEIRNKMLRSKVVKPVWVVARDLGHFDFPGSCRARRSGEGELQGGRVGRLVADVDVH